MNWKEIRQNEEYLKHLPGIWQTEQTLPRWFRAANSAWTATFEEFATFAANCREIFALFDENENLSVVVYVERQAKPEIMNIHLSVIAKIKPSVFIAEAGNLRTLFLRRGVRVIRGWVLRKNFALCRLLQIIGFQPTGLEMRYGASHGAVLRWHLIELRRG